MQIIFKPTNLFVVIFFFQTQIYISKIIFKFCLSNLNFFQFSIIYFINITIDLRKFPFAVIYFYFYWVFTSVILFWLKNQFSIKYQCTLKLIWTNFINKTSFILLMFFRFVFFSSYLFIIISRLNLLPWSSKICSLITLLLRWYNSPNRATFRLNASSFWWSLGGYWLPLTTGLYWVWGLRKLLFVVFCYVLFFVNFLHTL